MGAGPKRLAILKAGTANRRARERLGDFSGMFQALLAQPGHAWEVLDVQHGEFPADLSRYDGFAITGSRASAYDDEPWIHRLLETIRAIHARRIPLLGMCFGHQAVAQALGGRVEPSGNGWDVGVRALALTVEARDLPQLHGAPEPLRIFELHGDVVTHLPPGAVTLARSAHTDCEAFALGATTLCLQGHAEFDADVVAEALERLQGASILTAERVEACRATLAQPVSRDFWQRVLRGFFAQGGLEQPAAVQAALPPARK